MLNYLLREIILQNPSHLRDRENTFEVRRHKRAGGQRAKNLDQSGEVSCEVTRRESRWDAPFFSVFWLEDHEPKTLCDELDTSGKYEC